MSVQRGFADDKKASINDSRSAVLPGSASSATSEPLPPGHVATTINEDIPEKTTIAPPSTATSALPKVPLAPPTPRSVGAGPSIAPESTHVAPSPHAPTPKPRRFFRKFFLTLVILSTLGYGGGVYYSRINDNFHDFFTEYVPFGEEAVLYLEEREFRKRYPKRSTAPRDTGALTKIPSQSGVSWRVAEDKRHANATSNTLKPKEALKDPSTTKHAEKVGAINEAKKNSAERTSTSTAKPVDLAASKPTQPASPPPPPKAEPPVAKPAPIKDEPPIAKNSEAFISSKPSGVVFVEPEVDQPSRFPPEVTRIGEISISNEKEAIVQDLAKILNEIIAIANQENDNSKFSGTFEKAKKELSRVGGQIRALKAAAQKEADDKVNAEKSDFDRAAKELIRRLEAEMSQQQTQWQEEYQAERKRIEDNYEQKLKAEIERAHQVNEQKLENSLLEQAVELKKKFIADVKSRVEEEREGRLGKLNDLSKSVNELEKLTTDWTSIVDANLKTQHLHVAVEAVRSNLEKSQVPRPFIKELAALKEIAADDAVVNAAVASINPTAYQHGVPSSAHLIDRFRRVATEVRKASLLPEEAGVASHASSYVLSKLLFKKKGVATGNDVESILTRTETYLEEGDLDNAAREMNGLQGWAKTLSRDWLREVRKVLEVQQALDVSFLHS